MGGGADELFLRFFRFNFFFFKLLKDTPSLDFGGD